MKIQSPKKVGIILGLLLFLGFGTSLAVIVHPSKLFPNSTVAPVSPAPAIQAHEELQVIKGRVTLKQGATSKPVLPGDTAVLTEGDTITTDPDTIAVIHFEKESLVRLAPSTTIIFHSTANKKSTIEEQAGSIYVRFKKILGLRETFEVETPTAVATVRGTAFAVWYRKDRASRISVTKSNVGVIKKDDLGNRLTDTLADISENDKGDVVPGTGSGVLVTHQLPNDEEHGWLMFNAQADTLLDTYLQTLCPTCPFQYNDAALATTSAKLFPVLFTTPTPTLVPTPTKPPTPVIQSMPGEGYSRNLVKTDAGDFLLSCIGASKNNTRVITDAANDNDCKNDCPVMPLADFATKNGGYAAMNGMYFCPADYPACADKKNSFDTLFFISRLKKYLNSDNNTYSVLPFLAVEANSNPLFKAKTQDWGRDTGIQAGTAGNPLLISGGTNVVGNYALDQKQSTVKSNRGAFAQKGDLLYLCIVANATVPDSATVYKTLNADNAINIDGGGSSAMWLNGSYIYGPGRNIPTAIMFARK